MVSAELTMSVPKPYHNLIRFFACRRRPGPELSMLFMCPDRNDMMACGSLWPQRLEYSAVTKARRLRD